jgi:hypothetical protein
LRLAFLAEARLAVPPRCVRVPRRGEASAAAAGVGQVVEG